MARKIDGVCFKNMVDYAARNLNKHVKVINQLNVFPVPDGDTGTNMVTTIHKGLMAVEESIVDLPSVSRKFARSVVFEARGNSGVIVSQFLKGISEKFYDVDVADGKLFIEALEKGVQYAYSAVSTPVEGTMLTVIKDATDKVKEAFTGQESVEDIIDSFIEYAKISLEKTPELLSVLKESGVVDSGGAGIVCLFEGMKKYLDGEKLERLDVKMDTQTVDYDAYNRNSSFVLGYCTELLLQLLNDKENFEYLEFKNTLLKFGDSLVVSVEGDKVRIHIHTLYPEKVFDFCHKYGEFLSSKIENMTVQHTELAKRIMCSEIKSSGVFSVIAVASDVEIQNLFINMGADAVILCEENVSTKDYLDAFEKCDRDNILVFPNSSDAILSAMQAKKLYQKAKIVVLNSHTMAECYVSLPMVDFEEKNIEKVVDDITEIINRVYVVSITKGNDAVYYNDKEVECNEYYSFSGKELIAINKSLLETTLQTINKIVEQQEKEIITVFYHPCIEKSVNDIIDAAKQCNINVEFTTVLVENLQYIMTISFE